MPYLFLMTSKPWDGLFMIWSWDMRICIVTALTVWTLWNVTRLPNIVLKMPAPEKAPALSSPIPFVFFSHSSSDDQRKYRDSQELDFEKSQDPIESMKHFFYQRKNFKNR